MTAKPVIKVYLLPFDTWGEADFQKLHANIVAAAKGVYGWRINTEDDCITLFPSDGMKKGLGAEIHVEVDVPASAGVERSVEDHIAKAMVSAVGTCLPKAYVQCKVRQFDDRQGFASTG